MIPRYGGNQRLSSDALNEMADLANQANRVVPGPGQSMVNLGSGGKVFLPSSLTSGGGGGPWLFDMPDAFAADQNDLQPNANLYGTGPLVLRLRAKVSPCYVGSVVAPQDDTTIFPLLFDNVLNQTITLRSEDTGGEAANRLLLPGQICFTDTGDTTSGSAVVKNLTLTSHLSVGWRVIADNIPDGTTIVSKDSSTQVTLTGNATSMLTAGDITFLAPTVQLSGSLTSGSAAVTSVADNSGLRIGMVVTGPGVADGTYISSLGGTSTVTLSGPVSVSGTKTLSYWGVTYDIWPGDTAWSLYDPVVQRHRIYPSANPPVPYVVLSSQDNYLTCVPFYPWYGAAVPYSSILEANWLPVVYVAKPFQLRKDLWDGKTVTYNGQATTLTYTGVGTRDASATAMTTEHHVIVPDYMISDVIEVVRGNTGLTDPDGNPVTRYDVNNAGRAWTQKP
jgi:hypothetical protein